MKNGKPSWLCQGMILFIVLRVCLTQPEILKPSFLFIRRLTLNALRRLAMQPLIDLTWLLCSLTQHGCGFLYFFPTSEVLLSED